MSDTNVITDFKSLILKMCYSLMAGGIVILILSAKSFSSGSVSGKMLAYTSIAVAVATLMLLVLSDANLSTAEKSFFTIMSTVINGFTPFLLLLGVLVGSIITTSMYFDVITRNPNDSYKTMSTISSLFIIIQCILFAYTLTDSMASTNKIQMSSLDSAKLRLLSIVNVIALLSAFVSLKYYTTDGFM
jgi:glucan phosphoethanolaminetransferase (alkaline phosphatase superfamily)